MVIEALISWLKRRFQFSEIVIQPVCGSTSPVISSRTIKEARAGDHIYALPGRVVSGERLEGEIFK